MSVNVFIDPKCKEINVQVTSGKQVLDRYDKKRTLVLRTLKYELNELS